MTLWGGRFDEPSDDDLRALNDSLRFDRVLYRQDIAGSIAYARALIGAGILTDDEAQVIINGLEMVRTEIDRNEAEIKPGDEDIHTAVERRLIELVGSVGGKLHTGRSRNDQVATDFRLWTLEALTRLDYHMVMFQIALVEQAEQHVDTLMPGYTHLQPAQPITTAHWLLSFFWMVARDRERLAGARRRTNVMPLGSGALAGSPFPVDREKLARELGFSSISPNSLDAVSDRDFVAEILFVLSLLGVHVSRLAEDIILYSNPLFGFITLDDRYSTGSSIMPQKRNADPMELARGKAGRLIGHLTGVLTMLKGLPSTYNKDLQEDKEPLFDAVATVEKLLPVMTAIIKSLGINGDRMRGALAEELLATDLAEYLVRKGLPFREAHHITGRAVKMAEEQNLLLSHLPLEMLRELSDLFTDDVSAVFDFDKSVARRNSAGGTAPQAVTQQLEQAREWLSAWR